MSQVQVYVDPLDFETARVKSVEFFKSQLLPAHIKNPQQALVIMQMGAELGIPPMQALNSINLIQGRLSLGAQAMRAQVFKKMPNCVFRFLEQTDQICRIEAARDKSDPVIEFKYTIEEAQKAGLIKPGGGWQKNPTDMLIARCTSRVIRAIFPDCLLGVPYSTEETKEFAAENVIDVSTVYDKENHENKQWLLESCRAKSIPVNLIRQLNEDMHGKTLETIEGVINDLAKSAAKSEANGETTSPVVETTKNSIK